MEVSARSALSAYNAYKDLKIGTGLFDSMSMSYIIIGLISFPTFVLLQWGTQLWIWYDLWGHVTLSYSFMVGGGSYHVSFGFHPHLRSTAMPS